MDYKGFDITIQPEEYMENPRDQWEHFGHLITWRRGRPDGDKDQKMSMDDWRRFIINAKLVSLPVFIYDHSGQTIRTYPFSDPWDSGLWGFIYATYEDIRNGWNVKRVTKKLREQAKHLLEVEVEEYDQYLRGDIWHYTVKQDGYEIDSLGFIFGRDEAEKEAQAFVDRWLECQS